MCKGGSSLVGVLVLVLVSVLGSEFPERECCDSVYPLPPPGGGGVAPQGGHHNHHNHHGMDHDPFPEHYPQPPMLSTPPTITTESTGSQTKTALAIMNCIQARDSCMNNTACHPILEVVPRVCGAEKVACSTVTITKCQAALRTLQAFPYFYPTCLCREPMSDPACNTFRDYLFDHPCALVKEKEKDPYPVDALPTCDYALGVCKKESKCFQLLKDFRIHCKQSEDHQCKMEDGEKCHDAWTKLRLSPIFGCICPNNHPRCDRIFREVNYNPCVATDPILELNGSSSALFSLEQHRLSKFSPHMSFSPAALFPRQKPPLPSPMARTESELEEEHVVVSYAPGSLATSITVSSAPSSEHDSQLENPLYGGRIKSSLPKDDRIRGSIITTISTVRNGHTEKTSSARIPLQATCLTALQNCRRNPGCYGLLEQVLHYCDPMRCRQETCMKALQKFYREVESQWALDVAFCMCRKTDNRHDQCRLAQEQLHPVCAQRGDLGVNPPSCHSLAESCRAENDCRFRLEEYEQACAVDSVTRKCAGPTVECRNAMIRILGTKLRTSCACNGTDFTQLYDCLGWQRILWVNPCVVESQRDYHRQRVTQAPGRGTSSSTSTSSTTSTSSADTSSYEGQSGSHLLSTTLGHQTSTSTSTTSTGGGSTTIHTRHPHNKHHQEDFSTALMEDIILEDEETSTVGSTSTTRTEPTTTLQPPRYCQVRLNNNKVERVREGQSKRFYREDATSTCSEICTCQLGNIGASTCATLTPCLEMKHCYVKTEDEYYHLQPTYIAHRGKCLCYSGLFICEKPAPDTYTLDNGVFLFLGFSLKDSEELKKQTKLQVGDVVDTLRQLVTASSQDLFYDKTDPEETKDMGKLINLNVTECRLGLYKVEGENMIINATVSPVYGEELEDHTPSTPHPQRKPNDQLFQRERKQCLPVLQAVRDLINKQPPLIVGHPLLSILKLAAVQDNIPNTEASSASHSTRIQASFLLLPLLFLAPFHLL